MKKTVLSAVALALGLTAGISTAQADTRIGVTIYKYDDNFMALMRKEISKEALPHKVWRDCINCSKFPNCDETAMTLDL